MSLTGLSSDPDKPYKNTLHWRNNSGELDVFEAARYFSGTNENPGRNNSSTFSPSFAGENRLHGQRAARMSLDMPVMRKPINLDSFPMIEKQLMKEKNKYKQPSSPGGRLASFLNSLFNQTASKKKKKSKKDSHDHQEESPSGRKRRSSISHFTSTASSSVNPPVKTPTKSSYDEFQSFSDPQKVISVSENEEFRFSNGNIFKKYDDGADSDSSSDLFDLPNYDLDLPVYGTTNMDRIRIGATG